MVQTITVKLCQPTIHPNNREARRKKLNFTQNESNCKKLAMFPRGKTPEPFDVSNFQLPASPEINGNQNAHTVPVFRVDELWEQNWTCGYASSYNALQWIDRMIYLCLQLYFLSFTWLIWNKVGVGFVGKAAHKLIFTKRVGSPQKAEKIQHYFSLKIPKNC